MGLVQGSVAAPLELKMLSFEGSSAPLELKMLSFEGSSAPLELPSQSPFFWRFPARFGPMRDAVRASTRR
jgi:hypothetical protein